MLRYFIKRLLILIPTIIILAILIFLIINMIPGDPVAILLGTENVSNIEEIRENLGLNQSIYQRMWYWCVNICKGDLGDSYFLGRTVMQAIKERVPVTLSLATIALLFAVIIGLPLGILASVKPNSIWDTAIMGFSLIGASIPVYNR